MIPPLPPGIEGEAVAPGVHTGCPEPDRDGEDRPLTFDEHCDNTPGLIDHTKETTP